MGGSLRRTTQQIAKKRRGRIDALHEKSRDLQRLQRAILRDDKMNKIAAARRKSEQPRRMTRSPPNSAKTTSY